MTRAPVYMDKLEPELVDALEYRSWGEVSRVCSTVPRRSSKLITPRSRLPRLPLPPSSSQYLPTTLKVVWLS